MASGVRRRVVLAVGLVAALVATGGSGGAQPASVATESVATESIASLPPGTGASALRSALAALVDVGAADQAVVSFVDHAAVRDGGASVEGWFGLQVAIGVVDVRQPVDADAVEAATGVSLAEVASSLVVDARTPSFLTVVRGRFDAEDLEAALSARGYQPLADDRVRRWCGAKGCDGGFDVDFERRDDAFALFGGVLGRSFAVVLAGDVLAVSPAVEALDATVATVTGAAVSVLARPEVAAVIDALDVDAVVRQAWMPFGAFVAAVAPPGARSILFADARRGGDEWLVVAAAFDAPTDAAAFAAGAIEALGLADGAAPPVGTLQAALRAHAADAVVDTVAHHGLDVVRIVIARPFADGVGTWQDRPAELLRAMLTGVMRFEVPWVVR